jgi:phage anti-repressor protein
MIMNINALRTAIAQDALRSRPGLDAGFLSRDDIARRHLGQGMTFSQISAVVDQTLGGAQASQRDAAAQMPATNEPVPQPAAAASRLAVLLPVENATLSGAHVQTVDARRLHAWLEIGRDFPTWFRDRTAALGLAEGVDFVRADFSPDRGKNTRGRPSVETYVTLDVAKHISMMDGGPRGAEVRRYFLACERQAVGPHTISDGALTAKVIGGVTKVVLAKGLAPVVDRLDSIVADTSLLPVLLARMEALEAALDAGKPEAAPAIIPPVAENPGELLSARAVAGMAGATGKLRRTVQMASAGLRAFSTATGAMMARSGEDNRWLFDAGAVRVWLDTGGRERLRLAQ